MIKASEIAKLSILLRHKCLEAGVELSSLQYAKKLKNGWRFMRTRNNSFKFLEDFSQDVAFKFPELTAGQIVDAVSILVNTVVVDPIDKSDKLLIEIDPDLTNEADYSALVRHAILG